VTIVLHEGNYDCSYLRSKHGPVAGNVRIESIVTISVLCMVRYGSRVVGSVELGRVGFPGQTAFGGSI
jgi:hypothetical protein